MLSSSCSRLLLKSEMVVGGRTELSMIHICQDRACIAIVACGEFVAIVPCSLDQGWTEACLGVDSRR